MDSLQLIDLSKEDDCLLPLSLRDSVEDVKLSCAVGFDNASMIKRGKMRPVEERSLSELRKSLDWNSAFFTSQGLLNPEELSMINKAFQKTSCSCQPSFSSRKDLKPDIHKRSTVPINRHGLAPNQVVMEHRTRKAGAGSTLSSRSQGDFSSRLTSFTTLKTKMSKVHRSNESPSGASSKCISRNIKSRNIKPTIVDRSSVLSPLSSTCSSSTSPSRSFHNATSPSDFHNATSKVHCSNESHSGASSKCISRNIKSRNIKPTIVDSSSLVLSPLSSTCSSSTSPSRSFHNATSPSDFQTPRCDAARPPIRKIKCLGLRMPYPNTGPFDENQKKAGAGSTLSSRSQGDFSSRLTSFTTLKTKMSKVHRSNESPSGASSKCISRNIKSRNIKPTIVDRSSSVLSPLSSTCSSSTSPSRSFHNATSPSDFQTPHCDAARPPIRKIKCLGLRMPYPNTGPFDEAQAVIRGSKHKLNHIEASTLCISAENCLKVPKLLGREHDGCSKPKSNGQIHKEILKDKMKNERKSLKNDSSSFKGKVVIDIEKKQEDNDQCSLQESQKEDMCNYEDEVNGLSNHLDSISTPTGMAETSRLSVLSRSLDWDSAFVTGAGLLNNEEMTVINKGFAEANSSQPSYGTQKDGRPHQVSGQNQTLSDSDGFHLETLQSDLPKYVNPDIHIINKAKNRLKGNIASDHNKATIDKEKRQDGFKKSLSREHDGRKVGARGSKPESNGQIHNEMLKDRMNNERKSLKNDSSSFKGKVVIDIEKTQEDSDQCSLQESPKEDMCTYEIKSGIGLSNHLDSIGIDRYAEVKSQQSCAKRGQPFLETSRLSVLSRSLDWDSAFVTGAGLLTNEEMTVINKGFAEANSNQPSYGTQNDGRPHQVSGQNQTLSDSDGFHLETLESDLSKYVNLDISIMKQAKKGLKDDIASDHSKATIDKEKRQDGCKSQEESRRSTFLRKSLDWDSAFIHNAGLLNFEELSLINRGFKKADPIQSISRARKHIQTCIGSHQDQTCSKIGDLLLGALEADLFQDVKPDIHKFTKKSNACKATSFSSSTTENNPKVHHHSVESLSNDSSKRTRSISSGTSPASHVHVAISESDFQSPPHTPCHNF
ncbi:hypothetical protein Tco_0725474 [Tanacetum coccineum]|uniref:Uncharacterized protein n=1 Tax=Tanacetum coccineum TaxID=301880 RepID=A0ABQ4YEE4_9ASTR